MISHVHPVDLHDPFLSGTVLGPVLYGYLFDDACTIWQETCGTQGSCWIYDRDKVTWNIIAISVAVKFVACLTFFSAYLVYKPPHKGESGEMTTLPPSEESAANGHLSEGYANPALADEDERL